MDVEGGRSEKPRCHRSPLLGMADSSWRPVIVPVERESFDSFSYAFHVRGNDADLAANRTSWLGGYDIVVPDGLNRNIDVPKLRQGASQFDPDPEDVGVRSAGNCLKGAAR